LTFLPRQVGILQADTDCRLLGWGGDLIDPPSHSINIIDSLYCDSSFPDAFCSVIDSPAHEVCSAQLGSPVLCGSAFAGFLINDQACSTVDERNFLTFISVGEFGAWIREVTRPDILRYNDRFILEIAHYDVPFIESAEFQCVGSAVTERHILTTASCVEVEPTRGILVQKTVTDRFDTQVTSELPVMISIHPEYWRSGKNSSNIAVVLVRTKQTSFIGFSKNFP
jgi:hypothetical protein